MYSGLLCRCLWTCVIYSTVLLIGLHAYQFNRHASWSPLWNCWLWVQLPSPKQHFLALAICCLGEGSTPAHLVPCNNNSIGKSAYEGVPYWFLTACFVLILPASTVCWQNVSTKIAVSSGSWFYVTAGDVWWPGKAYSSSQGAGVAKATRRGCHHSPHIPTWMMCWLLYVFMVSIAYPCQAKLSFLYQLWCDAQVVYLHALLLRVTTCFKLVSCFANMHSVTLRFSKWCRWVWKHAHCAGWAYRLSMAFDCCSYVTNCWIFLTQLPRLMMVLQGCICSLITMERSCQELRICWSCSVCLLGVWHYEWCYNDEQPNRAKLLNLDWEFRESVKNP